MLAIKHQYNSYVFSLHFKFHTSKFKKGINKKLKNPILLPDAYKAQLTQLWAWLPFTCYRNLEVSLYYTKIILLKINLHSHLWLCLNDTKDLIEFKTLLNWFEFLCV